jgi:hypothetical protein
MEKVGSGHSTSPSTSSGVASHGKDITKPAWAVAPDSSFLEAISIHLRPRGTVASHNPEPEGAVALRIP